jgi:tRNA (pseudouridine54-N1)-methyltransferase
MRRFVFIGHKVPLDAEFTLNDLPGAAGRLDVLCRAVGASLFLSHGIRRDVETTLLLQNAVQVRILGDRVKRLNPDERSTAALLKRALESVDEDEVESTPGIFVSHRTLPETLDRLYQDGASPVVLHEAGRAVDAFRFPSEPAFILSDHLDFTEEEETALADLPRVSLGRRALHTSQCVSILHYLLDRREDSMDEDLALCHIASGEPKAQMIKSLLEDFGIPVNLVAHVPPALIPVTFDGLADVRIMVRPGDLARAQQIIRDYFGEPIDE